MFRIVVALTVLTHFFFVGYVVSGGLLALRLPRTIGFHVAAVLWAVISVTGQMGCPLTALERWARSCAGMKPLAPDGFIAHYITGAWYPADCASTVQGVLAGLVAASWAVYAWRSRRSNRTVSAVERPISSSGAL
jgi:hypothetical protein